MTESQEDNKVVSLEEFRKRHPVPSGKLLDDPYGKKKQKIVKEKSTRSNQSPPKYNSKLDEAMRKYGHLSGNMAAEKRKNIKKIDVFAEE